MNKDDLLQWIATDAGRAAMAGALGGVVRWLTLRERPREAFASLLVGSICAVYVGPLVVPLLAPTIGKISPEGDATGFASFIVGIGGISVASMLIEVFRARTAGLRKARSGGEKVGGKVVGDETPKA